MKDRSGLTDVIRHLFHGEWSAGCELWPGKPKLGLFRDYYDGYKYVLHLGPIWIQCDA